eukprot:GHRQ01020314.1.p2 GENE.GHRQ01020314.1~~GHRQ01020314.1.p2  ORF type:complete len:100 (+),score=24.39 GHRQ01020314.1:552-851(+)
MTEWAESVTAYAATNNELKSAVEDATVVNVQQQPSSIPSQQTAAAFGTLTQHNHASTVSSDHGIPTTPMHTNTCRSERGEHVNKPASAVLDPGAAQRHL